MEIKDAIKQVSEALLKNNGSFSVWEITRVLSDQYPYLTDGGFSAVPRHNYVRDVFNSMDWSHLTHVIDRAPNGDTYRRFSNQQVAPPPPLMTNDVTINDVRAYIVRCGPKTIKQIQSRFKKSSLTCEGYLKMLYNHITQSNKSVSKNVVSF